MSSLHDLDSNVSRRKPCKRRHVDSYDAVAPIRLAGSRSMSDGSDDGAALSPADATWPPTLAAAPGDTAWPPTAAIAAPAPAWPPSNGTAATPEPAWPPATGAQPELPSLATPVATPTVPDAPPAFMAAPSVPDAPSIPSLSVPTSQHYTEQDDEAATAAAFQADIQEILARAADADVTAPTDDGGAFLDQARFAARTSDAPAGGDDAEEPEPAADEQDMSTAGGHDVFDRLRFASQYDVGPVKLDLGTQFDAFDRQIVKEETARARRLEEAQRPPQPLEHMEALQDIEHIGRAQTGYAGAVAEQREQAAAQSGPEPAAMSDNQSFSVRYDVPLIPQQTSMSCWAAGAAMLVAFRDRISVDPSEIASRTGYWAQYASGLDAADTHMFEVFGLVPEAAQTYTIDAFRQLLEQYGPLWTAASLTGGDAHVRVVAGLEGDGTPAGTTVYIVDPWEPGMASFRQPNAGGRYTRTYADYEREQAALAQREQSVQGIYVAHLRERPTQP